MIDVIKFNTSKARMLPPALANVATHPLYQKRLAAHSRHYSSKLVSIQFGHQKRRFVTMKYVDDPGGDKFLVGLEANLPALLNGHNGRLLKDQKQMVHALTLARHIVELFVHPDDVRLILPGRDKDNATFIKSVECPIQIQDRDGEILNASHFTACRNFVKPSQIFPGQSVCHRSSGMDLAFYDKLAEAGEGECIPDGVGCTRIEVRFKSPRRLGEAIGLGKSKLWAVASVPFDDLAYAFRRAVGGSLIGALADAATKPATYLCPTTRSILKLAGDHVSLLVALAEQQRTKTKKAYGKIRAQVYRELALMFPVSLPKIGETWQQDRMSEIVIAWVEAEHQRLMARLGWPKQDHEDIAETFSGILMIETLNPSRKSFIRHPKNNRPF